MITSRLLQAVLINIQSLAMIAMERPLKSGSSPKTKLKPKSALRTPTSVWTPEMVSLPSTPALVVYADVFALVSFGFQPNGRQLKIWDCYSSLEAQRWNVNNDGTIKLADRPYGPLGTLLFLY